MIWIVLTVVAIAILSIALYNGLVQLRVRSENAWADVDVQLKRRHDLISQPGRNRQRLRRA